MNPDQLTNPDLKEASRSAFAVVDKLQERRRDTQLPAAMLLMYALVKTTGRDPQWFMDVANQLRRDARARQQPEIEALLRYFREELVKS